MTRLTMIEHVPEGGGICSGRDRRGTPDSAL